MWPLNGKWAILPVLLLPNLLLVVQVGAQQEVVAQLRGEVRVGERPLSQGTVILHQVSEAASGEVDSVRVGPDGSFLLPLPHVPDHASRPEIFFASVEYGGLLYFGPAVTEAFQLDSLYLIQAYDTLSVPPGGAPIPLSARNLFLEKVGTGWAATDVFELRHDGDRTLYSPDESVVWSYPLPPGVSEFQLGQGDMAPEVVRFEEGLLKVFSPLPPGDRYLMVRYRIPEDEFSLPMPGEVDRLEILVREPAPAVEFYPLSITTSVELEPGNVFRRYAAENLTDAEIRSELAPEPWALQAEWLGLLVAALLSAAGVIGYRRRRGGHREAAFLPIRENKREEILLAIAELDEEHGTSLDPSTAEVDRYQAARGRLLSKLRRLS